MSIVAEEADVDPVSARRAVIAALSPAEYASLEDENFAPLGALSNVTRLQPFN
jgi:hypothetical protein